MDTESSQEVTRLSTTQWKTISKKAVTVWRIHGIIASLIVLIGAVVGTGVIIWIDWYRWIIPLLFVFWIGVTVYSVWIRPSIRYRIWRYRVNEHEVDIQHGIFVIVKTLIPMIRVQHVDWTQGPILKKYGLATITIHTAATVHEIPALEMEEAEELRKRISELARVADEDV